MLSVTAASREGRQVTKAPRNRQQAPVKDGTCERSASSPASLELLNDDVALAPEGAEDLQEPWDKV